MRANDLVSQLLAFSRKSDGKVTSFLIAPIIEEALDFIRSSLPKSVNVTTNIHNQDLKVMANSSEVSQILMNLFTNAWHAMEYTGGQLEITLCKKTFDQKKAKNIGVLPGCYAQIIVEDTGVGIPLGNINLQPSSCNC